MAKNPIRKVRVYRRYHRRRYYSDSHRMLMALSSIISDRTSQAKSVDDLRDRLKKMVNDNTLWDGIKQLDKLTKKFSELMRNY